MEKIKFLLAVISFITIHFLNAQDCDYNKLPDGMVLYDFLEDKNIQFSVIGNIKVIPSKSGLNIDINPGQSGKIIFSGNKGSIPERVSYIFEAP